MSTPTPGGFIWPSSVGGGIPCATCHKFLNGRDRMICSRCKRKTYCSVACQKADHPVHRQFCDFFGPDIPSSPVLTAWMAAHQHFAISLALAKLGFPKLLTGTLRAPIWASMAANFICLLRFRQLPAHLSRPGRHNRLVFLGAEKVKVKDLQPEARKQMEERALSIQAVRFPSVTLGFEVEESPDVVRFSTSTHSFLGFDQTNDIPIEEDVYEAMLLANIIRYSNISHV
ncbi:hypothetical protein NLJ89_g5808 [Agrocybe chaxingu]|uniref:MYND-type domain-containing protein n=1 Tax=Agrocybe chaxingu TaxID=84603 RepID=A0A9W8K1T6_9AGAR|nr:hypothetical protein NLJ89_g5808 [Agrocybe chaxingu]